MFRKTAYVKPSHDEIVAISMLLGEFPPIICSCCMGRGFGMELWGRLRCIQCDGLGYDYMGAKTREALKL